MFIESKYLGKIEIIEDNIISFPFGILGFSKSKEFAILDIGSNHHFKILQDVKNPNIAFLITNPWSFFKDYEMDIPDVELEKINIYQDMEKEILVYNIITLEHDFQKSTANLLAPVIINIRDKKGKQFILNDTEYTTKHRLFPEVDGE